MNSIFLGCECYHLDLETANTGIDQNLHEDVIDDVECHRQVRFIRSNIFYTIQFADPGIRTPRGILQGNNVDLGNYHQCLGIHNDLNDMTIQGKYCLIRVPLNQTYHPPRPQDMEIWPWFNPASLNVDEKTIEKIEKSEMMRRHLQMFTGVSEYDSRTLLPGNPLAALTFRLAVCIPRPCTTQQAITSLLFNITAIGFRYTDDFCRLPDDKPRVPADIVCLVVFSTIGLLTLLSTCYDLLYTQILKKDPKTKAPLLTAFSIYTNGKRLMTFSRAKDNLQCVDGIRTLALMWIIVGHAFSTEPSILNGNDSFFWMISLQALWITSATISVDTFFFLGGLLLVYTAAGKMNHMSLLKNLHLFYLNRYFRMFPLLAATVLLQVSYFNRIFDGPLWGAQTTVCRTYWWTTLLHVQNLLNPSSMCISHSWYIAIDFQLYVLSPLILFWVFMGNKRIAWAALATGLLIPLIASTVYNFQNNFPAGTVVPSRWGDMMNYMTNYYFFTLTRASPFFVGMIFGYLLHLCSGKKVKINVFLVLSLWIISLSTTMLIFFSTYFIKQFDWDNQLVDNLMNSFMRPCWAAAVGWIIFACQHGYSGPINWFLSLDIWRFPARISYAMYMLHYPLMFIINDTATMPMYFSVPALTFKFLAHYTLAVVVGYLFTLVIDAPFTTIIKQLLDPSNSNILIFCILFMLNTIMEWNVLLLCILLRVANGHLQWQTPNEALDQELYEQVLNPELCHEQIRLIRSNTLLGITFADAGIRTPRGVLEGNTVDLGNYHQCLGINYELEETNLQGKYCTIRVPLSQNLSIPNIPGLLEWENTLQIDDESKKKIEKFDMMNVGWQAMAGKVDESRLPPGSFLSWFVFRLATCIPKPCSTQQALTSLLFNLTELGFEYEDDYCRLPNDKPWVGADTAAVVVFSVLGLVTLLSSCHDLYHRFVVKRDPDNKYANTFSLYTNGRRLMNFSSNPGTLHCLDGVRAIAMLWVLIGHTFTSEQFWSNPIVVFEWAVTVEALWVAGGHVTVDTFFTLSGILVVYTTAGKLNGIRLLKNLHLFYLNRIIRMFPILAAGVLLEASYFNRMADGPYWNLNVVQANRCRTFWWSTLLHIQNYMNPEVTCIGQSWYLAIDVQLHIISPIVLFWVLSGNKKFAWTGLTLGTLGILAASTTYNFIREFPREHEFMYYLVYYYVNTLTRASPFFVGMIFGYLLHLGREEKFISSKIQALLLWISALSLTTFVMYATYEISQPGWNNQLLDNLFNSFIRPIWATGVGLVILACSQGYGGPINWLLSLQIWKLPARLSYGIYIFHFALMTVVNGTAIAPQFFSVAGMTFKFLAHFVLCFVVSFVMTIIVDAPFSTIFKSLKSYVGNFVSNSLATHPQNNCECCLY
ncbi:hypothetical protein K1T71_008932 [Dendrolimus kikuchii]|uniref:Uncharacterized protein n=1 Tax=Dendrolimus kikuchii TaxID=765133 RepID=A0ACC1CVU6_9NEOP|nr:hypothetical protein K1T71_008932 [Dendrolimus kikuchii]